MMNTFFQIMNSSVQFLKSGFQAQPRMAIYSLPTEGRRIIKVNQHIRNHLYLETRKAGACVSFRKPGLSVLRVFWMSNQQSFLYLLSNVSALYHL